MTMNFCSQCAGAVEFRKIENDENPRFVCRKCHTVHYQNPKVVVGTLPVWQGKILLCQRNIEPAVGLWTIPAGYLELGETVAQGAIRETEEETGAEVTDLSPYAMFDIVHIGQIYLIFLARLVTANFHATPESRDVRLFTTASIPWRQIAFPVIRNVLEKFEKDEKKGSFPFNVATVTERMKTELQS